LWADIVEGRSMKMVLVAGGGGYIGSVLTELLLNAGHRVCILDRFFFRRALLTDLQQRPDLTLIQEDTRYVAPEVFEGVDVVMDLAGISNDPACDLEPQITNDVNLAGPRWMAWLAKRAGVRRYIYSSSCSVYGQSGGEPVTETSPTAPVSLYARTKLAAEHALLECNDDSFAVTVLRNGTAYGLSRRMRFDLVINVMTLSAFKTNRVHILGGGRQWRPLAHVRDLARAFMLVMEASPDKVAGEVFNVGSNDQNYQICQIAQMVRDVMPNTEVESVADHPDQRSYQVDFTKLERALRFKVEKTPYDGIIEIKEALAAGTVTDTVATRTVNYYRYLLDSQRLLTEVSCRGKLF
jgi:nucleoside-diphosphate-sugar epimerase